MEKKLVNEQALNIDGSAIEAAMKAYMEDRKQENLVRFMNTLAQSRFLVPVEFPKNMSGDLSAKLKAGARVTPQELPRMLPVLMRNQQQENFAPAFTSKEHLPKENQFQAIMPVAFADVLRVAMIKEYKVKGILLNPNSTNMILGEKILKMMEQVVKGTSVETVLKSEGIGDAQPQKVTMSVEQFHSFARKSAEFGMLPKMAHQNKKTFMENIESKRGQMLYDIYKNVYKANVEFPYEADDFDVMILDISQELTVVSMGLPSSHLEEGGCSSAFVAWNPKKEEIRYFVIEHVKDQSARLVELTNQGKLVVIGEAPVVGSEMSTIIDLIHK